MKSVHLQRCSRRSKHRIDCSFKASGQVGNRVTTCRVKVVVRGQGASVDSAKLHASCRSELILTAARAKAAMLSHAEALAGKRVGLVVLERQGRARFTGIAEWTRTTEALEECSVELLAYMYSDGEIEVTHRGLNCSPG